MFNFYDKISGHPEFYKQFSCGDALITLFNCPLQNKYEDTWSHHNYFTYVIDGRKIWHTANGSYDLRKGRCVFVRKGACIVEQYFETASCFIFFFMPDDFICEVLKTKGTPVQKESKTFDPVIPIDDNAIVHAFFQSMIPYFSSDREPDKTLLELKFKELILALADNKANDELLAYFCSLMQQPQSITLQSVMEDNFCFNLKLEEYARLSNRSLSAFKRDFHQIYDTTPGKWLLEKRLNHALHLLTNIGKTAGEASFESGFESPAHFSRSFSQRFGLSPNAVRQQASA